MRLFAFAILLLCSPALAASHGGTTRKSVPDQTNYSTSGSFLLYLSPYAKGSYVSGVDYTESASTLPASFPNNSIIQWRWPLVLPSGSGVYNLLATDFGDYLNTTVPVPITSRQVNSITTLTPTASVKFAGTLNDYDVIYDLFLTSGQGSGTTLEFEIEVFLHTPPYAATFVGSGSQLGSFVGSGVTWTVAQTFGGAAGNDLLFMPSNQADVPQASIDIKAMLTYLKGLGVITGNEYFNGLALGIETQQGGGVFTINQFSVGYN